VHSMGVKGLWGVVSVAGEEVPAQQLKGTTLALDAVGLLKKRGLRAFFYRVRGLLRLGIVPIAVLDGPVPEAKMKTIANRRWRDIFYKGPSQSLTKKRSRYVEPTNRR
ncbi:unnamed protein product, partial [Meganyctiphanes norvegica]